MTLHTDQRILYRHHPPTTDQLCVQNKVSTPYTGAFTQSCNPMETGETAGNFLQEATLVACVFNNAEVSCDWCSSQDSCP